MKKFLLSLIVTLTMVGVAVPVSAKPAPNVTVYAPVGTLALGQVVQIRITWENITGGRSQYPMYVIECWQDGDAVYATLNGPGSAAPKNGDQMFGEILGGGSSDWQTRGGPAKCQIQAYTYGFRGGVESITPYGSPVSFDANDRI